jgi:hypothetical protein
MHECTADFGTGLRAHLGLEKAETSTLEAAFERVDSALERAAVVPQPEPAHTSLEALEQLETELLERERALHAREAMLASRAGGLLAAAQALYDEVLGGPADHDDELARMRRRKSVA